MLVDLEDVVVAAVEDAGDLAAAQLAVGHVEPPVERADHLLAEPLVDRALVLAEVGQLVRADDGRVEAAVADLVTTSSSSSLVSSRKVSPRSVTCQ